MTQPDRPRTQLHCEFCGRDFAYPLAKLRHDIERARLNGCISPEIEQAGVERAAKVAEYERAQREGWASELEETHDPPACPSPRCR